MELAWSRDDLTYRLVMLTSVRTHVSDFGTKSAPSTNDHGTVKMFDTPTHKLSNI